MLSEIFSGKCASCGGYCQISEPLCSDCLEKVLKFDIYCARCGFPLAKAGLNCPKCAKEICPHIGKVYSRYIYDGVLRDAILNIKFKYNIRSALTFEKIVEFPDFGSPYEAVFCVPSHFLRRVARFFHPAEILAKSVSEKLGIPIDTGLKRKKYTGFQHKLGAEERSENVKNVFHYVGEKTYKKVLLVDDILTTGATLDECAMALRSAGVACRVDVYLLAITVGKV